MTIRLWKLGSLEHKVDPGPRVFKHFVSVLRETLDDVKEKGHADIVWDDAISVQEINLVPGIDIPTEDVELTDELRDRIASVIRQHIDETHSGV